MCAAAVNAAGGTGAVLTCAVGLQLTFDKETNIKKPEDEEAERKHPDLAKLDNRTLYEQLQENKEKAEEEAKARAALAFGMLTYPHAAHTPLRAIMTRFLTVHSPTTWSGGG